MSGLCEGGLTIYALFVIFQDMVDVCSDDVKSRLRWVLAGEERGERRWSRVELGERDRPTFYIQGLQANPFRSSHRLTCHARPRTHSTAYRLVDNRVCTLAVVRGYRRRWMP